MLRHACSYKLANDGHDTRAFQAYLGHRNIQNTTALAPRRFKEFFETEFGCGLSFYPAGTVESFAAAAAAVQIAPYHRSVALG